jgi:hypothetical protein
MLCTAQGRGASFIAIVAFKTCVPATVVHSFLHGSAAGSQALAVQPISRNFFQLLKAALPSFAGAGLAGTLHFALTAKHLREEGVDSRARLRAIPVAVRSE